MRQAQAAKCKYTAYGYAAGDVHLSALLGFNGERADVLLWAYILGNGLRVYSPELMRFHSPDIMSPFAAGGLNAYAYCAGDPVNFSDPSGQFRGIKVLALPGLGKYRRSLLRKSKATLSVQADSRPGDAVDGALVPPGGKQKSDRKTRRFVVDKTVLGKRIRQEPAEDPVAVSENEILKKENERLSAQNAQLKEKIAKLENQVAELRKGHLSRQ